MTTSEPKPAWHEIVRDALKENNVRLVTYVPDNVLKPLIKCVHEDDFFTAFPSLNYQHRPRRQFADTIKNRQRRRRIPKAKKKIECRRVNGRLGAFGYENRANLRSERQLAVCNSVID